jgi:hypothetical protein
VTVVYVTQIPVGYAGRPLVGPAELERYHRTVERRVTRRVVLALPPLTVPWDLEVGRGDVAREVQRVARERGADLIVVGTRRQGPWPACSPGRCRAGSSITPTVPSWWSGEIGRHRYRRAKAPRVGRADRPGMGGPPVPTGSDLRALTWRQETMRARTR